MRFCQQNPELLHSNESLRVISRFLSPERQKDPKTVAFSDEYYSVGLIAWYIWCLKVGRITPNSDIQSLPNFEATGTAWDRLWNSCLTSNPANRPNSLVQFQTLISEIKSELIKNVEIIEPSENEVEKENEQTSSEVPIVFYNFSAENYQIWCNKRPITNLFQKLQGTTLTVSTPKGALIEIYSNLDDSLLTSFYSSDKHEYSLPLPKSKPENKPMEKKLSLSVGQVGLILGALIIIIGVVLYLKLSPPTPTEVNDADGPAFAMVPPDGYTIVDTNNNNLLRKTGFVVDGTKWRFKEENWERFVPEGTDDNKGKWVKDNSQKVKLLQTYFEKIEVIESEGVPPINYQLITGNDSILTANGMETLNGKYYRFVNSKWYKKEANKWKPLVNAEEFTDIMESYFIESTALTSGYSFDYGYINGIGVRYRSEPSDRKGEKTVLGYFTNYKQNENYEPYENYENVTPSYVTVMKQKNGWYLCRIESTGKMGWFKSEYFISSPGC